MRKRKAVSHDEFQLTQAPDGHARRECERFLAALNDITRAALEMPDLSAMLPTLASRMGELFAADGCCLTLWDEATQTIVSAAAYGELCETYPSLQTEPGEATLTGSVLRAGRPLALEDALNSPYASAHIAGLFPTRSLLALPLIAGEQKLGAILVAYSEPHRFDPAEIARGEQAARQIALAVVKAQALQAEQKLRAHAEVLNAIMADAVAAVPSGSDSSGQGLPTLLEMALDRLLGALHLEAGTIWLPPYRVAHNLPPDIAEIGRAAQESDIHISGPLAVSDWERTAGLRPEWEPVAQAMRRLGIRATLFVPLFAGEILVGGIGLAALSPHAWDAEETALALAVGRQLGTVTHRLCIEEALRESEERLELALEGADEGMWDLNSQTGQLYLSPHSCEMLGFEPGEVEPNLQWWADRIHPEDVERVRSAVQEHLEGRTSHYVTEHRVKTKSGEWKWILDRGKVVERDEQGRPLREVGIHLDVTARKRAEEALCASEERSRAIVAALPDLLFQIDADGCFMDCRASAPELLLLPPDQVIGRRLEEILPPDLADLTSRKVRETLNSGKIQVYEYALTLHGEERQFEARMTPSGAHSALALVRDITERVRSEAERWQTAESLRVSLEKYRVLFESFPLGITISDRTGNILEVNRASERLLGLSAQEHGRRRIDSAEWHVVRLDGTPMPPEEYASTRALRENRLVENIEMGIDKGDGEVTWISVTAAPIPLEGYGVAIAYGDISERVKAQQALRQERDLSRALAVAAAVVSHTLDPDEVLDRLLEQVSRVVTSDAANIMLIGPDRRVRITRWRGYDRFNAEAFVSTAVFDLDQVPNLRQMAESGEPVIVPDTAVYPGWVHLPVQAWLRSYAGAPIRVRDEVIGFLSVDSATPGFFTLLHMDILRAFANHAAVALENARLYRAVQQELAERKRLEAQLVQAQKMEAIGRLAGGVAHDFNNHLTAIGGYAELLLLSLDQDDPRREDVAEICRAAERSTALTRQLLAFSRRQIIQPQTVNLNDLIVNMEKMLRRLIGEDVALVTVLDPSIWPVEVDPGQIEQVIMNLAVNARDAMPYGGRLTVETAKVRLDELYNHQGARVKPGDYVTLAVSDNGVGMDPETKSHLFEPFFTTKEKGKGTGLGLATVYGIVKQSEGYIFAYSEPGMGATFKIYLPAIKETARPIEPHPDAASLHRAEETILLVEDDAGVRAFARRVLERRGYAVLEAANAAQALSMARTHPAPIHLLLTDVVMPGELSGRALAERLAPSHPGMQVLYMSGYTDDAIVHHGVLEPGVHFIHKPFAAAALTARVRKALDGV